MSKGRGNFLNLCLEQTASAESNSSGDVSTKDSGLGSRSPVSGGEYRRLSRGKLLEELGSFSGLSLGGRGRIFDDDGSQSTINTDSRGRASLFQRLTSEATSSTSSSSCENKNGLPPTKAPTVEKQLSQDTKEDNLEFFKSLQNIHGSKGNPVKLAANYIRLESDPQKGVYIYEVRFVPNVDSTSLRMKYLNEHREKFGGTKTFDGVTLHLSRWISCRNSCFVLTKGKLKEQETF